MKQKYYESSAPFYSHAICYTCNKFGNVAKNVGANQWIHANNNLILSKASSQRRIFLPKYLRNMDPLALLILNKRKKNKLSATFLYVHLNMKMNGI